MPEHRYSREEVDAILGRAVERERTGDDLSRDQLVAIASEIGVSPASIDRAIQEIVTERRGRQEIVRLRRQAWRGFFAHLIPYLCVNGMFVVLNLLTTRFPWALVPMLGWGIGLFSHLFAVAFPNPERLERLLQREREREQRRQVKRQIKAGAKDLETAVGQGVAALLQAAADRVNHTAGTVQRQVRIDPNGSHVQPHRVEDLDPEDPASHAGWQNRRRDR